MTKKAIIQNITKKEFNEQYKNWSYGLKLNNGDEGFLSCKKEFSGGEEIEYELETLQSKAGKDYNKIKLAGGSAPSGFSGRGGYQKTNPAENFPSFALSYAKDVAVAYKEQIPPEKVADATIRMAEKFLDWLNSKKV